MKINDEFALSALAGVVACIPQIAFDTIAFMTGYTKYHAFQISASIFLQKELTNTPTGIFLGGVIWLLSGIFISVVSIIAFRTTGKDYWWLKGPAIVLSIMYIGIYGFLFNLGGAYIVPVDIPTNLSMLINNIIFSLVLAYLIIQWGADELFQRKKNSR